MVSSIKLEFLAPGKGSRTPRYGWETSLFNVLARRLGALRSRFHHGSYHRRPLEAFEKLFEGAWKVQLCLTNNQISP
jgi:hypothetical protein